MSYEQGWKKKTSGLSKKQTWFKAHATELENQWKNVDLNIFNLDNIFKDAFMQARKNYDLGIDLSSEEAQKLGTQAVKDIKFYQTREIKEKKAAKDKIASVVLSKLSSLNPNILDNFKEEIASAIGDFTSIGLAINKNNTKSYDTKSFNPKKGFDGFSKQNIDGMLLPTVKKNVYKHLLSLILALGKLINANKKVASDKEGLIKRLFSSKMKNIWKNNKHFNNNTSYYEDLKTTMSDKGSERAIKIKTNYDKLIARYMTPVKQEAIPEPIKTEEPIMKKEET